MRGDEYPSPDNDNKGGLTPFGWVLLTVAVILTLLLVASCQHPATSYTPPPFPHKGLTWEYNPNDPRLVLVAEDYLAYKR